MKKYEIKNICFQDFIRVLEPGHATYILYINTNSNEGHAVVIARNYNDEFHIFDPQTQMRETNLIKYINEMKMSTIYAIMFKRKGESKKS